MSFNATDFMDDVFLGESINYTAIMLVVEGENNTIFFGVSV